MARNAAPVASAEASDPTTKLFGIGLGVAVLLDVTLVRMMLVPAAMSVLGDRAWWLPRWLDRLLPNLDVEGADLAERLAAQEHAAEPERELAPVG